MTLTADLLDRRRKVLGSAYRLFYDEPLHLVRGKGTRVWDNGGREYLDAYNNVPSVGHCHPRVVEALATQAAVLNTHTRYLHEGVVDYAERLTALFPAPLSQVMLTCTGSEANDLALRVALNATGNQGIIVTDNAYHGVTSILAEISPSLGAAIPPAPHMRKVTAPDTFRMGPEGARLAFADSVDAAIASLQASGHGVAALICDTVFASDGIFVEPRNLLDRPVAAVRAAGGLFIADEVQSGLARPGGSMWAFERFGVLPDLVTLGKPLGGGHPLAAMIARLDLLESFGKNTRYFNTFGGNPVSAAVGLAILDVIRDEGLQQNAETIGAALRAALAELAVRYGQHVGDMRGAGLYATLEFVDRSDSTTASPAKCSLAFNMLRQKGVLVGICGKQSNCLKIRPPLPFSMADCDALASALNEVLGRLDSGSRP